MLIRRLIIILLIVGCVFGDTLVTQVEKKMSKNTKKEKTKEEMLEVGES